MPVRHWSLNVPWHLNRVLDVVATRSQAGGESEKKPASTIS